MTKTGSGLPRVAGKLGELVRVAAIVLVVVAIVVFCSPATRAASPEPALPTYEQIAAEARAQLNQGQLEEAFLAASAAISANEKRWEGYALAALALGAQGNISQAVVYVDKALARAPQEKQLTLKEMRERFLVQTVATQSKPEPRKVPTSGVLPPEAQRQLDVLAVIAQDADRASKQIEREKFLAEYLEKSTPFVAQYPERREVWMVRAMAAIELNRSDDGWEAGRRISALGEKDGDNSKAYEILIRLERLGWVGGEVAPGALARLRQEEVVRGERERKEKERAARQALIAAEPWRENFVETLTGMEFVGVPPGCFQMGDTFGVGDSDEQPVHEVCVNGFHIGKYEVTQGEWQKMMGSNPANFKKGARYPVETVYWDDAQAFVRTLNQQSGRNFRLPTEAEWEYAARSGGKQEKYAGGDNIDAVAWYSSNSGNGTHLVGEKQANGLGLFDMSGNVREWTGDCYGAKYYQESTKDNPLGPIGSWFSDTFRVIRGGGWDRGPEYVRSADRIRGPRGGKYDNLGFRLALPAK